MWALWASTGTGLVLTSSALPMSGWAIGLLRGGSLSHALETAVRGSLTD